MIPTEVPPHIRDSADPARDLFGGGRMAHKEEAGATLAPCRARMRGAIIAVEAMAFHRPGRVGGKARLGGRPIAVRARKARFPHVAREAGRPPQPVPTGSD